MRRFFTSVAATPGEVAAQLPGDEIVATPAVVMDRAFTLGAVPETVWPWIVQLGKRRAGWYLPRWLERVVPASRRGLRHIDAGLQQLRVGDVIPDWGGRDATFELAMRDPSRALVYRSTRGRMQLSWAIVLSPVTRPEARPAVSATRVQLRLRLAPVRRVWLANTAGELVDALSIAGLAAGLRERLTDRQLTATPLARR